MTSFKTTAPLNEHSREMWLGVMAERLRGEVIAKFQAGQREHKCDIGMVPTTKLLSEMEAEAVDLNCYLAEMRRRLTTQWENEAAQKHIGEAISVIHLLNVDRVIRQANLGVYPDKHLTNKIERLIQNLQSLIIHEPAKTTNATDQRPGDSVRDNRLEGGIPYPPAQQEAPDQSA